MENVVVMLCFTESGKTVDLEVPLSISADEFVSAIQQIYGHAGKAQDFLTMERPIALIRGKGSLKDLGMRMGSIIFFKG